MTTHNFKDSPDYYWVKEALYGKSLLSSGNSTNFSAVVLDAILELCTDSIFTKPIFQCKNKSQDVNNYLSDYLYSSGFYEIFRFATKKTLELGRFLVVVDYGDGFPLTEPLQKDSMTKIDFIKFIELGVSPLIEDPKQLNCYKIFDTAKNDYVFIHKSRCFHFSQYSAVPPIESFSMAQQLCVVIDRFIEVSDNMAAALKGANILRWGVNSLWEMLESGNGERIASRMRSNKDSLQELSIVAIDYERESLEYIHKDLGGVVQIYESASSELGLISALPESLLWGKTGDSTGLSRNQDLANYEDKIRPRRYRMLTTPLTQLAKNAFYLAYGEDLTLNLTYEPFATENMERMVNDSEETTKNTNK